MRINQASREELIAVPGIGEEIADAILAATPFQSPEDVLRVAGIGPRRLTMFEELHFFDESRQDGSFSEVQPLTEPQIDTDDLILTSQSLIELAGLLKGFPYANEVDPNTTATFATVPKGDVQALIQVASAYALRHHDELMQLAGRQRVRKGDRKALQSFIRSSVTEFATTPELKGSLVLANQQEFGIALSAVDGRLFATQRGLPLLLASTEPLLGDGEKAAFVVDVLIEWVSLLTSLCGVSIKMPSGARRAIRRVISKFMRDPRHRRMLAALLKAIRAKDWDKLLKLMDSVEIRTLFGEIFSHVFAEMGVWDYAITIAKFLAFLALLVASGGWAFGIRLAAVALDIAGLAVKMHHGFEKGWVT